MVRTRKERQSYQEPTSEPISVSTLGKYSKGDKGNTTLPIDRNGVKTIAILGRGPRLSIATKSILVQWR